MKSQCATAATRPQPWISFFTLSTEHYRAIAYSDRDLCDLAKGHLLLCVSGMSSDPFPSTTSAASLLNCLVEVVMTCQE